MIAADSQLLFINLQHTLSRHEMRRLVIIIISLCLPSLVMIAQDKPSSPETAVTTTTIVDHFTAIGGNTVDQPEALLKRLLPILETDEIEEADERRDTPAVSGSRSAGWRVQVFSDNNPRTAKAEASKKERLITARFPQHQSYVRYNAPYWRLRIGDFRSQQDANALADELRKAFPAYAKEIRVVRDRISLNAD